LTTDYATTSCSLTKKFEIRPKNECTSRGHN
jgi:hypothetical protein